MGGDRKRRRRKSVYPGADRGHDQGMRPCQGKNEEAVALVDEAIRSFDGPGVHVQRQAGSKLLRFKSNRLKSLICNGLYDCDLERSATIVEMPIVRYADKQAWRCLHGITSGQRSVSRHLVRDKSCHRDVGFRGTDEQCRCRHISGSSSRSAGRLASTCVCSVNLSQLPTPRRCRRAHRGAAWRPCKAAPLRASR